jgi:hypothetical protein
MNTRASSLLGITLLAITVASTTNAFAGPPLVCHPFEIGQAKSLPWVDMNYHKGDGGYDLRNLTADTLAILDANPAVLVRMETLRRATLYARQDPQIAKELLTRLHARAAGSAADGTGALAWFDAGYLAEAYNQWMGKSDPNPAAGVDGYGWVKKAISLHGTDPEMEFAAALMSLRGPEAEHREHVEKTWAGVKSDPLLAQNLNPNYNGGRLAELLNSPATTAQK